MAVHELGRIADGIAGNRALAAAVDGFVFNRTMHDLEAEMREKAVPEGQQLIHVESHRDTHDAARRLFVDGELLQQLQLLAVKVEVITRCHVRNRTLAAVAADEAFAAGEGVDGEMAVVVAQATGHALDGVHKFAQLRQIEQRCRLWLVVVAVHSVQRRAEGTHKAGDIRTHDLQPHLLLEGAQHAIVEEGASLHDDVLADGLLAAGTDDLI